MAEAQDTFVGGSSKHDLSPVRQSQKKKNRSRLVINHDSFPSHARFERLLNMDEESNEEKDSSHDTKRNDKFQKNESTKGSKRGITFKNGAMEIHNGDYVIDFPQKVLESPILSSHERAQQLNFKIEKTKHFDRWTLLFSDEQTEGEFHKFYWKKHLDGVRLSALLNGFACVVFGMYDYSVFYDKSYQTFLVLSAVRLAICVLIILACMLSYIPGFVNHYQSVSGLIFTICIVLWLTSRTYARDLHSVFSLLITTAMTASAPLFFMMRFVVITFVSIIVFAVFVGLSVYGPPGDPLYVSQVSTSSVGIWWNCGIMFSIFLYICVNARYLEVF